MIRSKSILILPIIFTAVLCVSLSAYSQHAKIVIEPHPEYQETSYIAIANDNKEISLTTYQTEINKGILRLRSTSDVPFIEQINIFSEILNEVLKHENNEKFKTLFIGRLINSFGKNNTEMSERLAIATYESPLWNHTKGKPVSGHENIFLETIANKAHIFPELSNVFAKHGISIKVSGIEKVLIGHPEIIPFGESLKIKGVKHTAKIPYDCLTWFSISKTENRIYLGGGYWKDHNGVYWKWRKIKDTSIYGKDKPIKYIEKKLTGADPDTFVFITERAEGVWGKDKNAIYFFYENIKGVDVDTWEPLDWEYSKDKNCVYKGSNRLNGADPKTFKIPWDKILK